MKDYKDYRGSYQSEARADWYENKVYKKDGFDEMLWNVEKSVFSSLLEKYYPSMRDIKVLDFACGTGRVTEFLESYTKNIDALDISADMINIAKTKTRSVNYIVADILENPDAIKDEYDLITTFRFVLFAEADLRIKVFQRLAKVIRANGGRIVVGIHGNPISRRFVIHFLEFLRQVPHDKKTKSFSLREMRILASSTGLKIESVDGVGFVPRKLFKLFGKNISFLIEKTMYKIPFVGRFGSNLIISCSALNSTHVN